MPSFEFDISPDLNVGLDFAAEVHKAIVRAFYEEQDAHGLTQADVVKKLRMDKSRVSRILSDDPQNLTVETIGRICYALDRVPHFSLEKEKSVDGTLSVSNSTSGTEVVTLSKQYLSNTAEMAAISTAQRFVVIKPRQAVSRHGD